MINLDDVAIYRKLDSSDMLGQLYGLPQQCINAWNRASTFVLPTSYKDIDKVVVLGMGGSAIGADLLRSFTILSKKPIIFINREYDLPAFVDEQTLVIASSYSGNTEETLTALSQALKKNCKKLTITTGGKLQEISTAADVPVFLVEHAAPPRAALGYSFIPLLAFLRNLGFMEGMQIEVHRMANSLKKLLEDWQETIPEKTNLPKRIAQNLYGKITVIYAAGFLSEVAHRWKTQINENSKAWSFYETLPELNHNAIVGYQFPAEMASSICIILLRSYNLNPRILVRYQLTIEMLQLNAINYQIIDAFGEDDLTRMMSLIYLGDWVSYYLALLYGIDPTPVKVIEHLKERLGGLQGYLF